MESASLINLAVLIVAGVVLVLTVTIGLFLNYHWQRYEFSQKRISQRRTIFILVSLILVVIMFYLLYLL